MEHSPVDQIFDVVLDDGTTVPTRKIQASDAPALQRFHRTLSDYSVYLRHIHALPMLSDVQAAYFTNLDLLERFAIIALDPANPSEIIAVVRYEGEPGANRAEYAALVTDAWQGKGLGSAMTQDLIRAARTRGIATFYATVLPENVRMLRLFRDLGLPINIRYEDGMAEVEIGLNPLPEGGSNAELDQI